MPRILPIILALALIVYALVDCVRTPHYQVPPGPPKSVWILLILLVPVVGAVAWLFVSRSRGMASGGDRRRPGGPMAPDDDPQFLADLDWQARKAYYERKKAERERAAREDGDGADA